MPNAMAFPKSSPARKSTTPNVRGTFPPRMSCRAIGGRAVKRTKQTFVARHPSQTNTEYHSNRSGRPQRLPPGYQYINPVHLRTISTSNKMSFHGNTARVH
ncbi:unnamed protein product, partial [Ectocarpus sp. 12 AP-2014]